MKTMQTTEVTEHRNMQFYSKIKHSIYLAMQAYMISSMTTSLLLLQALRSMDDHVLDSCIYISKFINPQFMNGNF